MTGVSLSWLPQPNAQVLDGVTRISVPSSFWVPSCFTPGSTAQSQTGLACLQHLPCSILSPQMLPSGDGLRRIEQTPMLAKAPLAASAASGSRLPPTMPFLHLVLQEAGPPILGSFLTAESCSTVSRTLHGSTLPQTRW